MGVLLDNAGALAAGFGATVALNLCGSAVGLPAGIILALALRARSRVLRWPARAYVELIRNTPFLLQAMILFAVLGVLHVRAEPFLIGAAAIAFYTAAYEAEIVRGGLASVPAGQWQAATALGLTARRRFRLVILPQTLPFVLPATANLLATVVKESAVLAAVAVAELTYRGQVIIGRTFEAFTVWGAVAALYSALVLTLIGAAALAESRLDWSRPGSPGGAATPAVASRRFPGAEA